MILFKLPRFRIIILILFCVSLCIPKDYTIPKLVKSEKDLNKALQLVLTNLDQIDFICGFIANSPPSEPDKLKYFARNSKNAQLISKALLYLNQDIDRQHIADSLVNKNPNDFELIREIAKYTEISNQDIISNLYQSERSSYLAKQLHDQDKIAQFLEEESNPILIRTLLYNLSNENTLQKYALKLNDRISKEIISWKLNDQVFINNLFSKEEDEIIREILQSRLDMLTHENYDWFFKLCDRHIFHPKSLIDNLSNEEIKLRDFLNYFYDDYFKHRKYIYLQDTISYIFDDRVNEFNSDLLFDKIENKSNKSIALQNLLLENGKTDLIYYSENFYRLLKSFVNYSTLPISERDKLLGSINTKIKLVYNSDPFAEKEYDVTVYPQIKLIFNKDMTRVKIDARISKDREYRFYNFENSKWKNSDKKEGTYIDCD